jgi:hypothetical protein
MRNISYPYFLFNGVLQSCRFSLLLASATTPALRLFCEKLWLGISPDGTDDVIARYTFSISLFAKQLIPNPAIVVLFLLLP